jgi:secondary thiamine-phosphate synthase enzyme
LSNLHVRQFSQPTAKRQNNNWTNGNYEAGFTTRLSTYKFAHRNGLWHFATNWNMPCIYKTTSVKLTNNENADLSLWTDLEAHTYVLAPENACYYIYTYEDSDDMPAHIKASLLGSSVSIPIVNGQIGLGIWQGIYIGGHRNRGGERRVVITVLS